MSEVALDHVQRGRRLEQSRFESIGCSGAEFSLPGHRAVNAPHAASSAMQSRARRTGMYHVGSGTMSWWNNHEIMDQSAGRES